MNNENMKKCRCVHHNMVPLMVFLIGLLFILGNFGYMSSELVSKIWPILLALIGILKMCGGWCKCCRGCSCGAGGTQCETKAP